MDVKKLAEQAKERARIAVEEHKLKRDEKMEQDKQKEAQSQRDDYPELLRGQILAGLAVKNTGDYSDDLAVFQESMRQLVVEIPDAAIREANTDRFRGFLSNTIQLLSTKPNIPAHEVGKKEVNLEPYIKPVLEGNLKARTFAALIGRKDLRDRVIASCVSPITVEARLKSMATLVNDHYDHKYLDNPDQFIADCEQKWAEFLEKVDVVNASGYVQSKGHYVVRPGMECRWGWRVYGRGIFSSWDDDRQSCHDLTYLLIKSHWYIKTADKKEQPIYETLLPIAERVRKIAVAVERLPAQTQKQLKKHTNVSEHYGANRPDWFGYLVHQLEVFGVWVTNQCIDTHSHPYHLNHDLVNKMLDLMEEYVVSSPVVAVIVLDTISWRIGSGWFYNCPEESLVENSKQPSVYLDALADAKVRKVFKGRRSPIKVRTYLTRLLDVASSLNRWSEGWGGRYFWQSVPVEVVVAKWLEHYNDDPHWQKKSEESKSA